MDFQTIQGLDKGLMSIPGRGGRQFHSLGFNTPASRKKNTVPLNQQENVEARKARLHKAAEDFEEIFVREILKNMRSTLMDGGMFGQGTIGDMYSTMMDEVLAEKISAGGTLGLADVIYRQVVSSIETAESSGENIPTETGMIE